MIQTHKYDISITLKSILNDLLRFCSSSISSIWSHWLWHCNGCKGSWTSEEQGSNPIKYRIRCQEWPIFCPNVTKLPIFYHVAAWPSGIGVHASFPWLSALKYLCKESQNEFGKIWWWRVPPTINGHLLKTKLFLMHFLLYRPTQIVNYRAIVIALNHPWADIKIFIHNSVKNLCVYT